jgi:hypothetical protein
MDLRPTIAVHGLNSSSSLLRRRRRAISKVIKSIQNAADKEALRRVLSRYRRKQRRALGETDSDPDPYEPSYVFFCLQGPRES